MPVVALQLSHLVFRLILRYADATIRFVLECPGSELLPRQVLKDLRDLRLLNVATPL